jgi:HSP20 family molecular chaperone IbpA
MANKDIQVRGDRSSGLQLDNLMQRFLNDPFGSWLTDFPTVTRNNLGTIKETDNAYLLAADIPGIPKEDVKIHVDGNMLTISAQNDQKEDEGGTYRREYHSFQQRFTLPSNVDADKIEAHCENGVLEVLIPKSEKAQPRKIEVQTGKGGFGSRLNEGKQKH